MTSESILKGNVVTVVHPDWRFTGLQGVVVGIEEDGNEGGPIGVRFPSWHRHLFDFPSKPDTIVRFVAEDLRVDKELEDPSHEDYLKILFGQMAVYNAYEPNFPLVVGDSICMYEGCEKHAFFKIWVNCWGAASAYYVCGEHACHHGYCMDAFPCKK
jgi:hypothetical protein